MRSGIGLVGRDDELAELDRFLDGAGSGALAVRGDAGVGKTALSGELCRRAAAEGWRVLRAIGVEAEKPFTLGGLNQMVFGLRERRRRASTSTSSDVLAPVFGADPAAGAAADAAGAGAARAAGCRGGRSSRCCSSSTTCSGSTS